MTKHKHYDMIVEWAATGKKVEVYDNGSNQWKPFYSNLSPTWGEDREYRFVNRHQAMIDKYNANPELVVEYRALNGHWYQLYAPEWHEDTEYRFQHKHRKLMDEYTANPRPMQFCDPLQNNKWTNCVGEPAWNEETSYRFKPEPIKTTRQVIFQKAPLARDGVALALWFTAGEDNVEFTIDPDTYQLIDVRMIN